MLPERDKVIVDQLAADQRRQEAPEADQGHDAGRHHRQGDADPRVERRCCVCGKDGPAKVGYRFDDDGKKTASAASAEATSDGRARHDRARRASRSATTTEIKAALQHELGLGNVMQVPRLEKIVLNMGVGRATQQASLLDGAVTDLTIITGQKPLVTKAKKSIAGFKLREGNAIGAKVTLRGDRMWEFYDRLVSVAIPRIRDFRGHATRSRSTAAATTRSASPSS